MQRVLTKKDARRNQSRRTIVESTELQEDEELQEREISLGRSETSATNDVAGTGGRVASTRGSPFFTVTQEGECLAGSSIAKPM
tara:strand:- start:260 stop:511 length:252 start_codon:yes stop_codon:yes gene_type:complete